MSKIPHDIKTLQGNMSQEELEKFAPDFVKWCSGKFGILDKARINRDEEGNVTVIFYTEEHGHAISVRPPVDAKNQTGYLGCISATRKPRAGEKHTRGNDLADGPYTFDTFVKILLDIVSYDMVELGS